MASAERLHSVERQPVAMHSHAMDNLRFIRDTMERSASFTGVPGWGGVLMGLSALVAAWLAHLQAAPQGWLFIWIGEAGTAALIGAITMEKKARRANASLFSPPGKKFLLNFAPPIFVGALLTVVLSRAGVPETLPGTWLCLYGAGIITGGAQSVRIVPVMGIGFIAIGCLAFLAGPGWGDWFLAAGFGGMHLLFGAIIARRFGG